jgi:glycosyltransferase involved in cell wall biosynthesis
VQILTVARWYPSHDSPGRGSFVADLVQATVDAGAEVRVASFDRVLVNGKPKHRGSVRAAARAGYDKVATPEALFVVPRSLGAAGVPVARLPLVAWPGNRPELAMPDHLAALRPFVHRLSRQWRPEVIHAHTGYPDGIVAAEVGRELGIPVVVTEHASTIETQLADPAIADCYRTLLEPGARLVVVSPSMRDRLARLLDVPTNRIGVLPNPVFEASFPPADHTGRRRNQLLWVGSLGEHKGLNVLLEAVALLIADRPDLRLRLVGDDRHAGDHAALEKQAAELGLTSAVSFDGWLDRAGVSAAMSEASVLVHPSPSETFGVVAAEAMLTGLPVATRRSGGVPWLVELSGGLGSVADGDEPAAFAAAIARVLDGRLPVDAETARGRLVREVGAAAVAARALELYAEAIRDVAGPTSSPSTPSPSTRSPSTRSPSTPTTPTVTEPPTAAARPRPLPTLLAAWDRDSALRLVGALSEQVRRHLVLVVPHSGDARLHAARTVRIVEADPVHRAHARSRRPFARLRPAQPQHRPTARRLLADTIREQAAGLAVPGQPVEVVALDAPAAMVVARMKTGVVRLAPGALRWLADLYDAEAERAAAADDRIPEAEFTTGRLPRAARRLVRRPRRPRLPRS